MNLQQKIDRILEFEGPIVASVTPRNLSGYVDPSTIENYASYLNGIGVKGVYAHGITCGGLSLDQEDRMKLSKNWRNEIRCNYPEWVGIFNVTARLVGDTQYLAYHHDRLGVDAIAVLPPLSYQPLNEDELLSYLKNVSDRAPSTPLIYCHLPKLTNVNFRLKEFVARAKEEVPRLVGMKYTSVDVLELSRFCVSQESKSFKIFTGYEQTLAPMLALGVKSAISTSFNFRKPVEAYTGMRENFSQNLDEVVCKQKELNDFAEELDEGSIIDNVKRKLNRVWISDKTKIFKVGL